MGATRTLTSVITARLDADTLARVRLACSPAAEVTAWLGLAARRGRHPVFGDPGAAARAVLHDPDAALVAGVLPLDGGPAYTPDLLTPKPGPRSSRVLDDQLDLIAATPPDTVAEQVDAIGRPLPPAVRDAVDRGTFAPRAAAGIRRFWAGALASGWSRLQSTMEADLAGRAGTMATRGVGALLDSLHEAISWRDGALTIRSTWHEEFTLADVEVVCVPAVLAWPKLSVQLCDARDAVLGYPAAGVGVSSGGRAIDRLVGPTRAALLRDLDVPRSTAGLAGRHSLSAPTISYHLKVLLRAGLVVAHRDGQFVLYRRTDAGSTLASFAGHGG